MHAKAILIRDLPFRDLPLCTEYPFVALLSPDIAPARYIFFNWTYIHKGPILLPTHRARSEFRPSPDLGSLPFRPSFPLLQ